MPSDTLTSHVAPPLRVVLAAANLGSLTATRSLGWETFDFAMYRLQAAVRSEKQLEQIELVVEELPDADAGELAERLIGHRPDIVGLRVGSLDDPSGFCPEADIFVKSAQPWDHMNPDLPKHQTYPPGQAYTPSG